MIIKILLDECLPKKLKYRIEELDSNFFAKTAPEMGWANQQFLLTVRVDYSTFVLKAPKQNCQTNIINDL